MKSFKKILIANRGEIAVRIIRATRHLGIGSVAVYSQPDAEAMHARLADERIAIGNENLDDSYLNVQKMIQAAKKMRCDAIHPGYGFLAENPLLVQACEKAGITFIGPDSKVMALMGNKIEARRFIKRIGVPLVEGVVGANAEQLYREGLKIGFPLLLKAAAGGGGKGMRIIRAKNELKDGIEGTSREAKSYFGDGSVYIEKYLDRPRHIEFQILGDHFGNVIHVFERECSIQRRYQKIIEEAPSVTLDAPTRDKMSAAALKIGREIGYTNAGTIEFLVDEQLNFYFLEMNTRIQVEHPVTEWTTGLNLVEEQIRIAAGNPLSVKQEDIKQKGHAIEARIYAEDPSREFMPSPGLMSLYREPEGARVRVDSGVDRPVEIKSVFDPLISKLIVKAPDRQKAIKKLDDALKAYIIHGVKTNIPFLRSLCRHPDYQRNQISTTFCDDQAGALIETEHLEKSRIPMALPAIGSLLYDWEPPPEGERRKDFSKPFIWAELGFWRQVMTVPVIVDGERNELTLLENRHPGYVFRTNGGDESASLMARNDSYLRFSVGKKMYEMYLSKSGPARYTATLEGWEWDLRRCDVLPEGDMDPDSEFEWSDESGSLAAPMPGKVIKINVRKGDKIEKGMVLMIIEAMKMENKIVASRAATVKEVEVRLNQMVDGGKKLILFE